MAASRFAHRLFAASLAVMASSVAGQSMAATVEPMAASLASWNFGTAQAPNGAGWTAERGTMTLGPEAARLQPDKNRRVVLLSPSELPDAVRNAEVFVIGVSGTGLERVRVQARRDARGGWITIADASGAAVREAASGFAIKRSPGARGAPIERLRIELTFRTTNPRPLTRISANPAPV